MQFCVSPYLNVQYFFINFYWSYLFRSKNKTSMRYHMMQHNGKRYSCDLCDFTTTKKFRVKQHIAIKHTDNKPNICIVCGKRFKMKKSLRVCYAIDFSYVSLVFYSWFKLFLIVGSYVTTYWWISKLSILSQEIFIAWKLLFAQKENAWRFTWKRIIEKGLGTRAICK